MSIAQAFKRSRDRNPAKAAIAFGDHSWTYSEFDHLTDNIARNLLWAGAEPGDRVALHMMNSADLALGCLGCLKAGGCVLVPVNTRLTGREIDYLLRHSGSAYYLGQSDLYDEVAGSCPAIAALERRYLSGRPGSAFLGSFDDLLRSPAHSVSLPKITQELGMPQKYCGSRLSNLPGSRRPAGACRSISAASCSSARKSSRSATRRVRFSSRFWQ